MARIILAIGWLCMAATAVAAERGSLFAPGVSATATALVDGAQPATALLPASVETDRAGSSLFAGTAGRSFFAPFPDRPRAERTGRVGKGTPPLNGTSPVARLLSLIALAEAGPAGYDAVQMGAQVRPPRPPTHMTLGEIEAWTQATPGQPHAIGRYQFIPPTLRRSAKARGFGPNTPFSPAVQDQLALVLLEEAGLAGFQSGQMDRLTFMRNLARIWAGLPLPNGKSYYEGHAGNAATMTWATFKAGMARIWPAGA